jgi:hypothetical protein
VLTDETEGTAVQGSFFSCAQHGQDLRAGISGPLADRGERTGPRDHRHDPDGEQARQRMTAAASLPRVRDLGEEIEEILAAGSQNGLV